MKHRIPGEEMRYGYSIDDATTFQQALRLDSDFLERNPQTTLVFRKMVTGEMSSKFVEGVNQYVLIARLFDEETFHSFSFMRMVELSFSDANTVKHDYFKQYCESSKRRFIILEQSIILW